MLDRVHKIAEIVAAFAIVGSLIFVGLQLRQNTDAMQSSSAQTGLSIWMEHSGLVVSDKNFAQSLINEGYPSLKAAGFLLEADELRVRNWAAAGFRAVETLYWQWRDGSLRDEIWLGYRHGLAGTFTFNKAFNAAWTDYREGTSPEFRAFGDEMQQRGAKQREQMLLAAQ